MERPIKQYVLQQFSLISATKRLCPPPCFDLEREWPISTLFSSFFFFSPFSFIFPCIDLERVAHINPFIPLLFSLFFFPSLNQREWPISTLFFFFSFLFSCFDLERERESGSYQPFYSTLQPFVFPLSVALSALCFSLYRENKGAADNEHLKH